MATLFLLAIITGILRAWYNYKVIKGNNWHPVQAAFIAAMVIGFLIIYQFQLIRPAFISYETIWQGLTTVGILAIFFLTPHWITHDMFLNRMRKKDWFYYNIDGLSFFDRVFGGWQFYIKAVLLFLDAAYLLYYYY